MENMTDIIWLDSIDSTNNEAKRRLDKISRTTVIAAREQTAGRGQRGNSWKTEAAKNLTFSLVMKSGNETMDGISVACQFVISEAIALGITGYLKEKGIEAKIKWPNDIYVGDRKICGILIENTVRNGQLSSCVAGIGLNVNQTDFPENIPNPVSMSLISGNEYALETELESLIRHISGRLYEMHDFSEKLKHDYLTQLYRKNEPHRYIDMRNGNEFTGVIRGINETALLQVENAEGRIIEFAFKEIGYII